MGKTRIGAGNLIFIILGNLFLHFFNYFHQFLQFYLLSTRAFILSIWTKPLKFWNLTPLKRSWLLEVKSLSDMACFQLSFAFQS
jgi:hypothetical protein